MPALYDKPGLWPIPVEVFQLIRQLEAKGYKAYLVGGAVRDLLLGTLPSDYDLASSATPDEIEETFSNYPQVLAGFKHGTVGVIINHKNYEITSFREDKDYKDHRRPDRVIFTTELATDMARRDFTMNALAYNPAEGLVDTTSGIADLRQGLIRCVGEPFIRFGEDALRILRAYRLAASYGFAIEDETLRAARHLFMDLDFIAPERIAGELRRLLTGAYFAEQLPLQRDIFLYLFPELPEELPVSESTFRALPQDFALRLSLIGTFLTVDVRRQILARLRLSREEGKRFLATTSAYENSPPASAANLLRMARQYQVDLADWQRLHQALHPNSPYLNEIALALAEIKEHHLPSTPADLAINGADLKALGWRESPRLGQVLETLWEDCIQGEVRNDRVRLLERVQRLVE